MGGRVNGAMLRLVLFALMLCLPRTADAACTDVGLVLAIDASGSIDSFEFEMQRQGYFAALTARPVSLAFAQAGVVDIAAVFWGDSSYPPQIVPWHRIRSAADLNRFATALVSTERNMSGDTHLGHGLGAALSLFGQHGRCADRRVIDLSGDGRASPESGRTPVLSLAVARDLASQSGVTVNALAITTDDAGLPDWYEQHLITGPFAFVLHARGLETFGQAMTQKLMRELMSGTPVLSPQGQHPM